MINEVINSILEAEERADQIVKNANAEAKAKLAAAEEKAGIIREEAQKTAREEKLAVISKANAEADELYEKMIKDAEESALEIKKNAEKNKQKAVDLIVGGII